MANLIRTAIAVVSVLVNEGKIPAAIANEIAKTFSVTDLRKVVTDNLLDQLQTIPGVGEKRAAKAVQVLTGRIPHRMDSSREIKTIPTRTKSEGFSLYSFNWKVILDEYLPYAFELAKYVYDKDTADTPEAQEELQEARKVFDNLEKFAKDQRNMPFVVKKAQAKVNRMTYSMAALIFGIDTTDRLPQRQLITVEHAVQEYISFNWRVAGSKMEEAEKRIEELQKTILYRLGEAGLIMRTKRWSKEEGKYVPEEIKYEGFASSASHQKNEKLVMAREDLMKLHAKAINFGLTEEEFLKLELNGAAIWKMRANLLRPLRQKLMTKDGKEVFLRDVGIWKDIKVNRHYENARRVGKLVDGEIFQDGPTDEERTVDDGGIHYEVEMNFEGQLTGLLLKGMGHDGRSSNEMAAKLCNVPVVHGDKLIYMGEGCWKGDKLGLSWEEYVARVDKLAVKYPGINNVWLLREADEPEDVTRVRRLTRSLIQQWIYMTPEDIRKITHKARKNLRRDKTVRGAIRRLAKTSVPYEEKNEIEKLFHDAPWLVLNKYVQQYLKTIYVRHQAEAAGNKFVTEGTYPYIVEDQVAVYQIQRYGCDPNSKNLGVLKSGEMSVPGVANGAKMCAVRFPANYQTAKVMKNVACKEAFSTMGNIAVISIYDDILVRQDGDVDGDEMAIILNALAIKYTEKMIRDFNPPVIIFEHGDKTKFDPLGTKESMIKTMYDDLWKAKKFDGVGKYANLATLCAHLASIAYQEGDMEKVRICLNQMSLASTGAILAIDQVKGNKVSPDLVARLEEISKIVRKECNNMMPYTQQFVKGIPANECNEASIALCDSIASLIMRDTGAFELNTGDMLWDATEAKRVLTTFAGCKTTSIRRAKVSGTILNELADNWFNDKENDDDKKTFEQMKNGEAIGIKQLSTLLWRNACALEFRMEGENLTVKREEYRKTVKNILFNFGLSVKWEADGNVFSDKDKKASIINGLIFDALMLKNNGIEDEKRGTYAMFILKVFAEELDWAVKHNKVDTKKFKIDMESADDLVIDDMAQDLESVLFSNEEADAIEIEPEWVSSRDYDEEYYNSIEECYC